MKRKVLARVILAFVGVAAWGYGANVDDSRVRLLGIAILAVTLLLRLVPPRYFGDSEGGA